MEALVVALDQLFYFQVLRKCQSFDTGLPHLCDLLPNPTLVTKINNQRQQMQILYMPLYL